MDKDNLSEIGKMVDKMVRDAVHSREFGALRETLKDIGRIAGTPGYSQKPFDKPPDVPPFDPPPIAPPPPQARDFGVPPRPAYRVPRREQPVRPKQSQLTIRETEKKRYRAVGRASAVLMTVFGSIGIGVFGVLALLVGMVAAVNPGNALIMASFGVLASALLASGGMLTGGVRQSAQCTRMVKYLKMLDGCKFCAVKALAEAVGCPEKRVARDLKRMVRMGALPNAYFCMDKAQSTVFLDEETYQYYLNSESEKRQRLEAERHKQEKEKEQERDCGNEELAAALADGRSYIRRIKEANDQIPGEEMSRKISRLETVTSKIFDHVAQRPEKLSDIRKLMSYYLPTTLKLLEAYRDFEAQTVAGENIVGAKKEIVDTLDTINASFENLFDTMFQNDALDISTDISVLEAMLAQEGLSGKDFPGKNKE